MRLTGTRAYYRPAPPKMPPGLVELMEGLTKEVLKHNPNDVYGFCAGHVQQLIEKRDGPSRKKSLSVEQKIARAQEKVRQRAEKRKQEYDKKILEKTDDDAVDNKGYDELTLHVPQLNIAPEVRNVDNVSNEDNATIPQEETVRKAPVHHEHALENASEVEICHKSGPKDNTNDQDGLNIESTNEETNTASTENVDGELTNDETNENKSHVDISDTKILDIETTDNYEDNLETKESSGKVISDKTNVNAKNDSVKDDEEITNSADSIGANLDSDENVNKDTDKADEAGNEIENTIHNNKDSNNIDIIQANEEQPDIQQSSATEQGANNINQTQLSNNEDANVEEIPLSTNIEKTEQLINVTDLPVGDVSPEPNSIGPQDVVNDTSETKQDDNTIAGQIEHADNPQLQINNEKEENKEPISTVIPESHSHLDLSSADVDQDIETLVTADTANDANQISEPISHITEISSLGDMPLSQVDEENSVLDRVTSDNEELQHHTRLNTEDNFSSDATQNIEAHNEGELLDNTNVNIQNDNNDTGNMDLETAAITIQKVFRTFLFKSRGSTEDAGNDEGNFLDEDDKNKEECDFPIASSLNIDRRAHGITRMDTVLQTVNEEKSLSLSDDSSTLSSAATIIQAHVRGFLVRNRLNSNKTVSTNSLAASNSNEPSITSLDAEHDQNKNKTILNIHIVPEGENYLSRDESLITSMELSLDSSPPSSINLHPLGYDKSERRKQLKREDAIQSVSPPSNNSGKLSEDFDSVKELSLNDHDILAEHLIHDSNSTKDNLDNGVGNDIENNSVVTAVNIREEDANNIKNKMDDSENHLPLRGKSIIKLTSDEMDVVTPFISNEDSTLIHSGEFHDAVLPTRVSRSDTSVVSEFKNVLVYFLLWNHS